jgi:hypothetical protein
MFSKLLSQEPVINALSDLAFLIQKETIARLIADKLDCPANIENARVTIVQGRKYAKIIVGSSVRYFVKLTGGDMVHRAEMGTIYASASRNAPNFNRSFGTVFDMNDFTWGEYEPRAKLGTRWTMVPTRGGYFTAVRT